MAGVGRVFQGVEFLSRRAVCQARHREYVRALADGVTFTQVAHALGVSEQTGKVWHHSRTRSSGRCERASIAPQAHWCRLYMTCQPHRISKRFLSLKERMLIFGWRVEGLSIRDIARRLGRLPRAVSRELKRNGMTSTCYNPYIAHMRAGKRLARPKARKCANPRLWSIIWGKLELRWSPERICAYLRMRFPHKSEHEPVRGDDLPVHLHPSQRHTLHRDCFPHAPRTRSQAPGRILSPGTTTIQGPHGDDQRTARQCGRPGAAWPLGRRLNHRSNRTIRARHARGTLDLVHAVALRAQRTRSR